MKINFKAAFFVILFANFAFAKSVKSVVTITQVDGTLAVCLSLAEGLSGEYQFRIYNDQESNLWHMTKLKSVSGKCLAIQPEKLLMEKSAAIIRAESAPGYMLNFKLAIFCDKNKSACEVWVPGAVGYWKR